MKLTTNGIRKAISESIDNGLTADELMAVWEYGKEESHIIESKYSADRGKNLAWHLILAGYAIGFRRGKNYQKRHDKTIADQPS